MALIVAGYCFKRCSYILEAGKESSYVKVKVMKGDVVVMRREAERRSKGRAWILQAKPRLLIGRRNAQLRGYLKSRMSNFVIE